MKLKKLIPSCFLALLLVVVLIPLTSAPAHAELLKGTRLRVVAAEGTPADSFKVMYGPEDLFKKGSVLDATKAFAEPRGVEYIEPGAGPSLFNLYIIASENYKITTVRITEGFVEYYENGSFTDESTLVNITNPDMVVLSGEALRYTDGQNSHYVEQGGGKDRNIPQTYTGPAYFGQRDDSSGSPVWRFTLSVTTELADSGALTIEEARGGITKDAIYTLDYGAGNFKGSAQSVMSQFNAAVKAGTVTPGMTVTLSYDPTDVGAILVKKGDGDYTDPEGPDWSEGTNSVSFVLDKIDRIIRVLYVAPPGRAFFLEGTNPFGFTTFVDVVRRGDPQSLASGSFEEVNAAIAAAITDGTLKSGNILDFTVSNPEDIVSIKVADLPLDLRGQEGSPKAYGENILQGRGFSLTLTIEKAFQIQANYRTTPGKLFIQETTPNKGVFVVSIFTGSVRIFLTQDIAMKAEQNITDYMQRNELRLGSTINITFPDSIEMVRMATGDMPSVDITSKLQDRTFSYQETTEDVTFYVKYRNANPEFVINPTFPQNPGDPGVPPDFNIDFGSAFGPPPGTSPGPPPGTPPGPPPGMPPVGLGGNGQGNGTNFGNGSNSGSEGFTDTGGTTAPGLPPQ